MNCTIPFRFLTLFYIGLWSVSPVQVSEQVFTGDYKMLVNITKYDFAQDIASADVQINVDLPSGTGFVYIPLPFPKTDDEELIIEPTSDNNLVLFGYIRPSERYAIVQISLSRASSKLIISIRNVQFELQRTAMIESNTAVVMLFNDAYSEFDTVIDDYTSPRLTSITVNGSNIQSTEPPSKNTGIQRGYTIEFQKEDTRPPNITIFLIQKEIQLYIYIALGIMGIILGLFTAPRVVTNRTKAIWTLILALLGLAILVIFFFVMLNPDQRLNDTITISTGTISGLMIGFVIQAVWHIITE